MFPVTVTLSREKNLADSLNETATLSAIFPSHLLVSPGIEFCSWIRMGTRNIQAERTRGPDVYPPTPTTRSGRFLIRKHMDWAVPTGNLTHEIQRLRRFLPSKPAERMVFNSNPSWGRTFASRPFWVPTNEISISISCLLSALAKAIPG